MAQVFFSVSARTARLIGRENVANAEGAIIELVKNCYDADSPIAIILLDKANDTILIIDGGDGMTDQTIMNEWMTIGTDNKFIHTITSKGRVKSGAKGIGRFALDRLGEQCTMITFPVGKTPGFKWIVNWGDFEEQQNGTNIKINEVFADLQTLVGTNYKKELAGQVSNKDVLKIINKAPFVHGTLLKITGLRDEWRNESIAKIYENLELLTPPDGANKIKIYLFNGAAPGKNGLLPQTEFSDYDYKVVATYKKNVKRLINIKIHRNEFDPRLLDDMLFDFPDMKVFPFDKRTFKKEHFELHLTFKEIIKGFEDKRGVASTIPDFEFTFYFLKNQVGAEDREKFNFKEFAKERGAWLKKFGGIKLYRDNFRIRPYGEIDTPTYDWLMLGERYTQNPAAFSRKGSRVRPNQVAGIVKFSRLENAFLEDKSSREGLQENDTFDLFKNILIGIIKVQEDDRSTVGYNLHELYNVLNEDEKAIEDSEEIAAENDVVENDETQEETRAKNRTVKKGFKAAQAKLHEKNEELAISRAMASAGIMIASFSHEFHGIKNDLSDRTSDLKKFLAPLIDQKKLKTVPDRRNPLKLISLIEKQDDKIRQWIEFAVELTRKDRRRNKTLDLRDYFSAFSELWIRLFEQRDVQFSVDYNKRQEYLVRISELDLDTIFDNLIINSIEAFDRSDFSGDKKITVNMTNQAAGIVVQYTDSGPGIPASYKNINNIFAPFETSKTDDLGNHIGTGLGMWLVKSSVDANKAKIALKRPAKGFAALLTFKKTKK